MKGRPRLPTKLQLMRGNPTQHTLTPDLELIRPASVPAPPRRLKDEAREEWLRIAPELHQCGILTKADLQPLMCYCIAYGRWCQAEDAMAAAEADDPRTFGLLIDTEKGSVANPLVKIARDAARDMMRYAVEFGFTPASRARIAGPAAVQADSKFGELLACQ